jgi:hypothetical protein
MRTTFREIRLFSDLLLCRIHFYIQQKRVAREQAIGKTDKQRETERSCERVAVWAINLTVGQIFITARERIIIGLIKMNI